MEPARGRPSLPRSSHCAQTVAFRCATSERDMRLGRGAPGVPFSNATWSPNRVETLSTVAALNTARPPRACTQNAWERGRPASGGKDGSAPSFVKRL